VGYGPDPAGVIGRLRSLGIPSIRGNYDDGIGNRRGQCGCYYVTEQAKADGAASYAFTDAALGDADHAWLAALPDDIRLDVDGVRVLLAHGSPRRINEYLLLDRKTISSPDSQTKRMPTSSASGTHPHSLPPSADGAGRPHRALPQQRFGGQAQGW